MIGLYKGRSGLRGFIARKENHPARLFRVALKHRSNLTFSALAYEGFDRDGLNIKFFLPFSAGSSTRAKRGCVRTEDRHPEGFARGTLRSSTPGRTTAKRKVPRR